jgi:hypothetical protein
MLSSPLLLLLRLVVLQHLLSLLLLRLVVLQPVVFFCWRLLLQ